MATPYSKIYTAFLHSAKPFDLFSHTREQREDIMEALLKKSQSDFQHVAVSDLSDKDDGVGQYNGDLAEDEVEILANGMLYYWYSAQVFNSDNFRNFLNTKDFSKLSPANMLKELSSLRECAKHDFDQKIIKYSIIHKK